MRTYITLPVALCLFLFAWGASAQEALIHSHNDYRQRVPFYQAYAQQLSSIEADIFEIGEKDVLLVAHDKKELSYAPTLDDAYIRPLANLFRQNHGRAWKGSDRILTLLVDLKTSYDPTLDILIGKLNAYPEVFNPEVNPYAVRVVISGERPDPGTFGSYPPVVSFDGDTLSYTAEQLKRIAMISLNFQEYSSWNGKGAIKADEHAKVAKVIADVHALGKPIRFWGTPDGVTAWNTFRRLGVDVINTDQPEACAAFFRNFHQTSFALNKPEDSDEVARAKRLDKATAGFQGFRGSSLNLSEKIGVYTPTYRNDGKNKRVKNVILLIGDGMGLVQVCAADAINESLSLLNMKYLGLQQTEAADTYTTDSAAGGSALATGRKHNNRHISMSPEGEAYPSLTDLFHEKGYACGVVTLGNAADATPAAFYGHSTERDNSDEITHWLLDGKLNLLCGSGTDLFTGRADGRNLFDELRSQAGYQIQSSVDQINQARGKAICIDERMGKAATAQTLGLLAQSTQEAIRKLTEEKNKGFFLMVEGAKIDYAGHANSLPGSILETFSFDLAIAEALKFADSNGETLVIVTGDHETGGLTLVDRDNGTNLLVAHFMTDDHTPVMLPVYAYGPQANQFIGVYQNTEIFRKILKAAGIN